MRGANTGTLAALVRAVRSCGVKKVTVIEDVAQRPGQVTLVLGDQDLDPATLERVQSTLASVRPAGVRVLMGTAAPISIRVAASLQLNKPYGNAERQAITAQVRADLAAYFDTLEPGETVRAVKLRTLLGSDPRILVASEPPGGKLLEPWDGEVSLAARLLGNGDYIPAPTERAVLALNPEWPQIVLASPGVRVDAELRLAAGQVAVELRRQVAESLAALLETKAADFTRAEQRALAAGGRAELTLSFAELRRAVPAPDAAMRGLRFSVVYERTGRVLDMTAAAEPVAPQKATFAAGERPRLGDLTVELAGDG